MRAFSAFAENSFWGCVLNGLISCVSLVAVVKIWKIRVPPALSPELVSFEDSLKISASRDSSGVLPFIAVLLLIAIAVGVIILPFIYAPWWAAVIIVLLVLVLLR